MMKTTIQYLDAVKARLGIESDYGVAKALGITRAAVSRYRTGVGTFDDEVAMTVAEILKINPLEIIVASRAERAKNDVQRKKWERSWENFSRNFRSLVSPANARQAFVCRV